MAKNFNTLSEIRAYAEQKYSAFHHFISACGMSSVSAEGRAKMEVFSILIDACEFISDIDDLLNALLEEFSQNSYSSAIQQLMRRWLYHNLDIDVSEDFFNHSFI